MSRGWEEAYEKGRTGDHVRGNVILAEGILPWEPIPVVVTCKGQADFSTKTDSRGSFVIARPEQVGTTTIIGNEKSLITQLAGCAVSAVLPGFDSSKLTIQNRDVTSAINIGTIILKREDGADYTAISATTAAAPKEARRAFEKARRELFENKPQQAERELQKAVEIDRQFAEAWYQLGKIQAGMKSPGAWNSFANAIAADAKFTLPYEHMAELSAKAQKWEELVEETEQALEKNPRGTLDLWYYNALGNFRLKKYEIAKSSATKSLSMDPLHVQPDTEQLLAGILVELHEVAAALEHLRNCLTYYPQGPNYDLVKKQIGQLEAGGTTRTAAAEKVSGTEVANSGAEDMNLVQPSEAVSAGAAKKSGAKVRPTAAADELKWRPANVGDFTPALETGTACNLEEVLPKVEKRIQEFVENVERFTATETLYQEAINGAGEVTGKENRKYEYMVAVKEVRPGILDVEETLSRSAGAGDAPGGITTKGLPALLLIFHPNDSGSFSMRCEGQASIKGKPAWQIYFRQRADKPNTTRAYNFGPNRASYVVALKGRAWFAADTHQILRLETELIDAVPEIQLSVDHTAVEYGPVHFSGKNVDMWLPQTAELYSDLRGRRIHQRMSFGNYTLFSVDEREKIATPKTEE